MEIKRKVAKTEVTERLSANENAEGSQEIKIKGVPIWQRGWFVYLFEIFIPFWGPYAAYKGGHKKLCIMGTFASTPLFVMVFLGLIIDEQFARIISLIIGFLGTATVAYKLEYKKTAIAFGIIALINIINLGKLPEKQERYEGAPIHHTQEVNNQINEKSEVQESQTVATQKIQGSVAQEAEQVSVENVVEKSYPKTMIVLDNAYIRSVSATSEMATKHGISYSALNVLDNDINTAWVEGAKGYGEGEGLNFNFSNTVLLKGFDVWNGYQKDDLVFKNNSVPKNIRVVISGKFDKTYTLDRVTGKQRIILNDRGISTNEVKIIICDAYKGNLWKDTCISEIKFLVLQ